MVRRGRVVRHPSASISPGRKPARTRLIGSSGLGRMSGPPNAEELCTDRKDEPGDNGVGGTLSATLVGGPFT
jgi:hypothetical protein